jgi:hypothetical protein
MLSTGLRERGFPAGAKDWRAASARGQRSTRFPARFEDTPRRERRLDTIAARVRDLVSAAWLDGARDERALRRSFGSGSASDYATNRALRPSCQRTFPGTVSRGVIRPT